MAIVVAALSIAIWLYLLLARGFFWRGAERDESLAAAPRPDTWPSVTAIVPARNEADVIGECVASLLRQSYPGVLSVIVVDDQSSDGTGDLAKRAAAKADAADRLEVIRGSEPPPGWTGKLWAMRQGLSCLEAKSTTTEFVLFTDADITYQTHEAVERLMRGALARGNVLTSLMVKLRCESVAERALVPAFIYFFAKLYPFAWVNNQVCPTAAAAGGCMLVRRDALAAAGSLEAIRSALIDDCALGAALKTQGPIWLGLTEHVVSLRAYPHFSDIRRMVVRSAYAELRYSPLLLLGALLGMAFTYLAPPLLAVFAEGLPRFLGVAAWAAMGFAFQPTLRLYRRSHAWGLAMPVIAALYTAFTIESAVQHWRGCGGAWKGRFQAAGSGAGA